MSIDHATPWVLESSRRSSTTTRARPCGQKKRTSWPRRCQCRPRITPCCENEMFVCSDGLPPESSRYHDSRRSSQNQPRSSPNLRRVTTRTPSTGVLSIGGVTESPYARSELGLVGACEGAVGQREQVLAVAVLAQRLREREQPIAVDPGVLVGDLLGAGDLEALPRLDRLDEVRGLQQRLVRARVEPRVAAPEALDHQLAAFQVAPVEIGDLELAAR